MTPYERQLWVLQYIHQNGGVDVLNAIFEEAYCAATGADHKSIPRELRALYDKKQLRRAAVPSGMPYSGCCKWVRSYFV